MLCYKKLKASIYIYIKKLKTRLFAKKLRQKTESKFFSTISKHTLGPSFSFLPPFVNPVFHHTLRGLNPG